MTLQIRAAVPDDVPWLLGELRAFDEFFGTARSLFPDEAYATEKLVALMDPAVGCFFVAERVELRALGLVTSRAYESVGFIVGIRSPHFFNPAITTLHELFWWVTPDARGSSAGARLLEAFMTAGRTSADWVVMTLEAKSPVDPASLERRGFHLHERSYLLEVA